MTTNLKRIPFIPKLSREFKPMKHYICETDTSAKLISRTAFMRQLAQQPCPKGQVFIDFDDGMYLTFIRWRSRSSRLSFRVFYRWRERAQAYPAGAPPDRRAMWQTASYRAAFP